jgi:transcription-repair coupling factor (superfamily II helicase)
MSFLPSFTLLPAQPVHLGRVPFSSHGELLANLAMREKRVIVYVGTTEAEYAQIHALLTFIAPELPVFTLPAWDTLPYDRVSPSNAITSQRVKTLAKLAQGIKGSAVLLTSIAAASQKLIPPLALRDAYFDIRQGTTLERSKLQNFLEKYGYQRTAKVMEAGEYAIRGSIIDIFPAGSEIAYRLDCFGDDIESIRQFDPLTQRSDAPCDNLQLQALREITLDADSITQFRTNYREMFGAVTRDDPLYEAISAGRIYAGMEHWLPLFYKNLCTLETYLPNAAWVIDARIDAIAAERDSAIQDYYQARQHHAQKKGESQSYLPIPPASLYDSADSWHARLTRQSCVYLHSFDVAQAQNLPLRPAPLLAKGNDPAHALAQLKTLLQETDSHIILACNSSGSMERLRHLLQENGVLSQPIDSPRDIGRDADFRIVYCCVVPIDHGYGSANWLLLSEADIMGDRVIRTQRKKRKSEAFFQEAASFTHGELVVHREHGIGRFEGLITVEVNDSKHDCLQLIYDGGDKLFLPVENIELISRYGHEEGVVALDKLGGVSWQRRKSALKKKLKMAAEQLLKIAAERATKPAAVLQADVGLYDEFCARFPYTETEDQLQAIEDVRSDLASGIATDRLICGDVGFGKTEVALRAAFIAISNKQQVAVVVPTTLLARQHFNTFTERFRDMPVTIRQLSRMVSAKDAAQTRAELAEGHVNIVVGTHALLADSIHFKQLGLVIIDEEQHFGVKQKEKLKEFKSDVHVITLSATPIPRTLQMSLSGVRELSLITTPPIDRLAIRSVVMPFDSVVIREAILRERHRGGKTFYVTPRVKYIAELRQKIEELLPEIKIAVAHGQMPPSALDKIMNDMYDGKYDVLISTAIIESGIDMPTANTMIIDHPEMFGLAQLYQLRGRVGRGKTRAYAYFTLPHHKQLTPQATRRLDVMQQLDHLGAGFSLASHDMDIRGFGNILGEEQSGHIKEVGLELYQAMLEEAVEDMKTRKMAGSHKENAHDWSPQINMGISVLIPESYVQDLSLRLALYRRVGQLQNHAEIEDFAAELHDRFGTIPEETSHLLAIMQLKLLCKQAGIERLDMGDKGMVIGFRGQRFEAAEALLALIAKAPARFKIRADQRLTVHDAVGSDVSARIRAAMQFAQEMVGLLPNTIHNEAA